VGFELQIARRHLRAIRRRRRATFTALIAVAGVGIGVAALVIVLSVMNGFGGMVWDRLLGINAHITVRRAYSAPMGDYGKLVETLAAHPDVVGASPFIQSAGFVIRKPPDAPAFKSAVMVRGVDAEGLRATSDIDNYLWAGDVDLGEQPSEGRGKVYGVVIGKVLAEKLGAALLGTEIRLLVFPDNEMLMSVPPMRKYVVTGIFDSGYYEFDSGLVFVSLKAAQRDAGWGDEVSGVRLRLTDPFLADAVSGDLRDAIANVYPRAFVSSWMYEQGNLYVWIRLEKWFSFIALSLIVVVAGFNIISILTMNVTERRREIGILMAMGATPRSIARIFTLEGLAIGLGGVAMGDALGFLLCWIQETFEVLKLPGDVYIIDALPVDMQLFDFIAISGLAVFLCYLFTRFPARDAASLDPVESIRFE
jgi:lipoprotein-releasing system permease protein